MPQTLLYSLQDTVACIQLNRARYRNAINSPMVQEFHTLLDVAEKDDNVRAIVIFGDHSAFSSGQDLKEPENPSFIEDFNALLRRIEELPKATVAAISGWCIGGGLELALCCDLRYAADDSKIGDWHSRINSIGGGGATVRLPRLIGMSRAKELIFTGDVLSGTQALEYGLVNRVGPGQTYVEDAIAMAAKCGPANILTVAYAKRALHAVQDVALIQEGVAISLKYQQQLKNDLEHQMTLNIMGSTTK